MKKRHLIAAGIVVAVVAMVVPLWVGEGPLWRWVMLRKVEHIQLGERGWMIEHRLTGEEFLRVLWSMDTGFKTLEVQYENDFPQKEVTAR